MLAARIWAWSTRPPRGAARRDRICVGSWVDLADDVMARPFVFPDAAMLLAVVVGACAAFKGRFSEQSH
jgi:hypothetical protein